MKKYSMAAIVGIVGTTITNFIGGWDSALITLVTFMAVDFISGLLIAAVFRKSGKTESGGLSSKAGWEGLAKKVFVLMFVLVGHRIDITLGVDFVRTAVIIGYIAIELISIVENAGIMGIPIPDIIYKAIDMLNTKAEVKKSEKDGS